MSLNSYNDITLRLDTNNNNANSYLRIMDGTTGDGTFAWIGSVGGTKCMEITGRFTASSYIYTGSWLSNTTQGHGLYSYQNSMHFYGAVSYTHLRAHET